MITDDIITTVISAMTTVCDGNNDKSYNDKSYNDNDNDDDDNGVVMNSSLQNI